MEEIIASLTRFPSLLPGVLRPDSGLGTGTTRSSSGEVTENRKAAKYIKILQNIRRACGGNNEIAKIVKIK